MRNFIMAAAATLALAGMITTSAVAQNGKGKGKGKGKGGINLAPPINLTVSGWADGGVIPNKYTCAGGQNAPSPAMTWDAVPGAQSYVIIMHDPDPVMGGNQIDVTHWGIFNIPGDATSLPEGIPAGEQANGTEQMMNMGRQAAYMGPCAPPGNGYHHYTIEMYALNSKLDLPDGAPRADVEAALPGKILAKRVYIGMFKQE